MRIQLCLYSGCVGDAFLVGSLIHYGVIDKVFLRCLGDHRFGLFLGNLTFDHLRWLMEGVGYLILVIEGSHIVHDHIIVVLGAT